MMDFFTALALVLVIEGMVIALFPGAPAAVYRELSKLPAERLRVMGLIAAAVGLFIVWLIRG